MQTELEKLLPFKNKHSISETFITLFLPNKILDLNRFEALIKTGGQLSAEFQSFKPLHSMKLELKVNKDTDASPEVTKLPHGFQLESYREGKVNWLIRYNPNHAGTSSLSLHCLDYNGWNNFYENVFRFLSAIVEIDNSIYVDGYSLTYLDQFDWISSEPPSLELLFKNENEYIPKMLFSANDGWNFQLNFQRSISDSIVKEDINSGLQKVNDTRYNMYLMHTVSSSFDEFKSLHKLCNEKLDLRGFADRMHDLNKEFLKNILRQEVLDKIGIKE